MTNRALVQRCQHGDKAAFECLLNLHYEDIFNIAYRWCDDQYNAQDITQQACLKLSQSIKQFQFKSSFSSWLYRLVINCAKDFYKSPTQHNTREKTHSEHENISDDRNNQRLYAQQILHYINELPEDFKEALILVHVHGLSHAQAAEKIDIKESTVSWRVHEARKQLKHTFQTSTLNTQTDDDAVRGAL